MKKVIRTPDFPIVRTKQGKLHGYQEDDVFHFYGIRYGRAERFQLPEPEPKWDGIRDAKSYGYICPLMPEEEQQEDSPMSAPGNSFEMQHVYWPMKEQCLYLNVWTKHLEKSAKKPVMVWLHGGGFSCGSSIEIPAYNGHNLCDYGDVVIVNLNHRLNCLGFLDLSSFGENYKYSGCAGMADVVLALQWVKENIEVFGGDPDNVTVAGQSGGGGKAAILMQMPPADGLYHKVISQSGALRDRSGTSITEEKRHWQSLGEKTAEILGLTKENIETIDAVPYEELAKAAVQAGKILGFPGGLAPWHCADIPYVFRNVEMEPAHCTGYQYAEKLQDQISKAWIAFMKKGNPSTRSLKWSPYTKEHPDRMIFAEECGMEERDDSRLLKLISESCKKKY